MDWQEQFQRQNDEAKKDAQRIIEELEARRIAAEEQRGQRQASSGQRERQQARTELAWILMAGLIGYILGRSSRK
jgi:hypothetical protein